MQRAVDQFEYSGLPAHVVFGPGVTRSPRFMSAVEAISAGRLLLVAAETDAKFADPIAGALGSRVAGRFTDVRAHVPVDVAQAARTAAAEVHADGILSVGGGSTTGTAKAIALTSGLPIIAVPTTYAGSEVTPVWGLTEGRRKRTGVDPRVLPKTVIYDPELTTSLPVRMSVASGLNALAHCLEAFWAPGRNPVTSAMAEEGVRSLVAGLREIVAEPTDLHGRSLCLLGAWLAGTAFAATGSDIHHKICHVLGGAYDLPHAEMHAVVLPYATAIGITRVPESEQRVVTALGGSSQSAVDAVLALEWRLGAPRSLSEVGLTAEQLPGAIELVAATLAQLPEPVDATQAAALMTAAFNGAPLEAAA